MSKSRKQVLQSQIAKARQELSAIEDQELVRANRKFVGRYFKVRNNYSCWETEADYWWLYTAVTGISDTGNLQTVGFQIDKYGKVSTEVEELYGKSWLEVEITKSEFDEALTAMLSHIERTFGVVR